MKRIALLLALCALTLPSFAASTFTATVKGSGPAMIFIPGLTAPAEVWDPAIEHYAKTHQVHRIAIAGFAGAPAPQTPLLPGLRDELLQYIRDQKLSRPVLVGHSMGGFVALWMGLTAPDAVGPIVAVDGVPFGAALLNPSATAESAAQQAAMMAAMVRAMTPEQFAASTTRNLSLMLTKQEDIDRIGPPSGKSDPATVAQAWDVLMSTDLRRDVAKIKSPVLVIAAGAGQDEAAVREKYEANVAAIPDHRVLVAKNAKHYVMVDDLPFVLSAIDAFLAAPRGAEPPAAGAIATVDQLSWLSGCWEAEGGEPGSGEQWTRPAGGSLLGVSRTVRKGNTVAHEFMQIRVVDGKLTFIAKPSGQPEASFRAIRSDAQSITFENPEHDFPQRVIYRRDGDRLIGRIEGKSAKGERAADFPMRRVRCE